MKHVHLSEITSTNDYATHLLDTESEVVVTAEFQTHGRGRNKHTWFGDDRINLYYTYGKKHSGELQYEDLVCYQYVGCLAVLKLLKEVAPQVTFRLKYPNDVYAKEQGAFKKISGVLVEHTFEGERCSKSLIGIGLNVLQQNLPIAEGTNATSLARLGIEISPQQLVEPLTNHIKEYLQKSNDEVFTEWSQNLNIFNKVITIVGREGLFFAKNLHKNGQLELFSIEKQETILIDNTNSIRYELE